MGFCADTAELFSDLPMGEEKFYVYADLANTDISASDLSTLNGKKIAMMENSVQTTQLYEWEEKHNVKTQPVFINGVEEVRELKASNEIVGVLSAESPIWREDGMSAITMIGESSNYYAINKQRPDLKEELDAAMRKIEADKPFYSDELYQRYLSAESVAVLSDEESSWLSQHGAVRIGFLKDDPGVSTLDSSSGKPVGIINDYMDYAVNCIDNYTLN